MSNRILELRKELARLNPQSRAYARADLAGTIGEEAQLERRRRVEQIIQEFVVMATQLSALEAA